MARIALFSDVHGNLPALEAVMADMDRRMPDMRFCLGDLVGYAPWPNEVVDIIRRHGIPTIAGNYDEGVGLHSDNCGCAYKTPEDENRGAESIAYTNEVVADETRAYLRDLPRHFRLIYEPPRVSHPDAVNLLMVHGSPQKINQYLFEDHPERSLLRMMDEADADVMLFGHTHKPFHRTLSYEKEGATRHRHAINIGSVGKPKDGDSRACYVVLDINEASSLTESDGLTVEFVRVEYDVERAASAVETSVLPNAFADMLRRGV